MPQCLVGVRAAAILAEFVVLWFWTGQVRAQDAPAAPPLPAGAVARLGPAGFWHGAVVRAVAFSPDETLVASVGIDHKLCLWETATGRLHLRLDCPRPTDDGKKSTLVVLTGATLLFSGDSKTLALADESIRTCRLWDIATGKVIADIDCHTTVDDADPDAGAPTTVAAAARKTPGAIALAHDGRLLAQTNSKDQAIHVFVPGKKEPVQKLAGLKSRTLVLAFAPSGNTLASAGDDQAIRLWDLQTGKVRRTLTGHRAAVQELTFAPGGQRLLSASADGSLRLWDASTGQSVAQVAWKPTSLHAAEPAIVSRTIAATVHDIWFENGGQRFGAFYSLQFGTTGGFEDAAVRFDAASGKMISRQVVHDQRGTATVYSTSALLSSRVIASRSAATALALAPHRNLLARVSSSQHVYLVDMATGAALSAGLHAGLADLAMARDHVAVIQQGDPAIHLWNWKTNGPLQQLNGHTGQPFLVGFAPGGLLATASRDAADRTISVWNAPRGDELRQIVGWHPGVMPASTAILASRTASNATMPTPALSPDGQRLAFRGADGKLRVATVASGAERVYGFFWKGDGGVAFTPDGKRLVVSDAYENRRVAAAVAGAAKVVRDGYCRLRLFDVVTGKEDTRFAKDPSYEFHIMQLAVAGRYVLAGCRDGAIRAIDLETTKAVRDVWTPRPQANQPAAVAILALSTANRAPSFTVSADGRMIALRTPDDGTLKLLETATGGERLTLPATASPLACMAFGGDSKHLVTGYLDSTVLVWTLSASTGQTGDAEALWQDLAHADAARAFRALRSLLGQPAQAMPLAQKHLHPVPTPDEDLVRKRIRDLDSPTFATRQKAQDELTHMGDAIQPYLEKAAADAGASTELQQRVAAILKRLDSHSPTGDMLRHIRAVELLERLGTADSQALLRRLANGAVGASLTLEARAALERLTR